MATVATVTALHKFEAENDDELPFEAGERVEVLEKDDIYGDGWWRGRNVAGMEGLFPASYITEDGSDAQIPAAGDLSGLAAAAGITSNGGEVTQHSPAKATSRSRPSSPTSQLATKPDEGFPVNQPVSSSTEPTTPGGTVMKNTIGDVQAAINSMSIGSKVSPKVLQVAAGDLADDESLAPSHSGANFDRDSDDEEGGDIQNPIWNEFGINQKDTRTKLAEQAKIENERKEQEEREKQGLAEVVPQSNGSSSAVPSGLVYSDESDDEEETPVKTGSHIKEKDVPAEASSDDKGEQGTGNGAIGLLAGVAAAGIAGVGLGMAAVADAVGLHSTAEGTSEATPVTGVNTTKALDQAEQGQQSSAVLEASTTSAPSKTMAFNHGSNAYFPNEESPLGSPFEGGPEKILSSLSSTSAPTNGAIPEPIIQAPSPVASQYVMAPPPSTSTYSAVTPLPSAVGHGKGVSEDDTPSNSNRVSGAATWSAIPGPVPDWTVAQVLEWAKIRGFDDAVCEKFEEHEITGDILLELDANLLKELDIPQFGKRIKIANAISELRRPNSQASGNMSARSSQQVGYSGRGGSMPPGSGGPHSGFMDGLPLPGQTPTSLGYGSSPASPARGQYAQDYRQYASTPPLEVVDRQRASSTGLPEGLVFSPESEPRTDEIPQLGPSPVGSSMMPGGKAPDGVGLGFGQQPAGTAALAAAGIVAGGVAGSAAYSEWAHGRRPSTQDPIQEEDESGANRAAGRTLASTPEVPQGDAMPNSAASSNRDISTTAVGSVGSKNSSVPPSPSASNPKRISGAGSIGGLGHKKNKASIDGGKTPSDRGFFSGNLGRNRKPAPRYPSGTSGLNIDKDTGESAGADRRSLKGLIGQPKAIGKSSASPTDQKQLSAASPVASSAAGNTTGQGTALKQIGKPDHSGFMKKKGERYNSWKLRYFVLKGPHLYYMKDEKEEKIKGHIDLAGYKVLADGNSNPGSYGFQIVHDREKPHYFSSNDHRVVKEWMKNLMKATISRDYSAPVVSSCNIPTIPLREAQMMNPAPRPPSPAERDATQRASRRDNPNQLTARDASVLMSFDNGSPTSPKHKARASFSQSSPSGPPRPSRDVRRPSENVAPMILPPSQTRNASDASFYPRESIAPATLAPAPSALLAPSNTGDKKQLLDWVNANLPTGTRKATSIPESFVSGELMNRVIENICGAGLTSPVVSEDAFAPVGAEANIEGLFSTMDRMIDEGVDTVGVSINDIRLGHEGEITKLLRSLKQWGEEKRA